MDKAEVARRQLGTALDMFLREQDPVSVHSLAMAGGEVAEQLASNAGAEPFVSHVLKTFPDMDKRTIRNLQRKFSNAFKHVTTRNGLDRQDTEIIKSFDPKINEDALLIGWHDMMLSGLPAPIEAQVFMVWYFAKYPEKLNPTVDTATFKEAFPDLPSLSEQRQLDRLRDVIRKAKKNGAVMQDPRTDRRPLVLPWGIGPPGEEAIDCVPMAELTDAENAALIAELKQTIAADPFPLVAAHEGIAGER